MKSWVDLSTGKKVERISDMPDGVFGFVYLIKVGKDNLYIGKKSVFSFVKKKFGKKELSAITDKRKKTYSNVTKESNWKKYTGSNKVLNELIKSGAEPDRIILEYAYSSKHLTYLESKHLFKHGVIEPNSGYLNDNILGKFFRKDFVFSESEPIN